MRKKETAAKTSSANPFEKGTYAFKSLITEQPNYKETVDYWKTAYKSFTGLPPSKKEAGTLHDDQDNASFVALYNPSSNATADCRVVTCTQTTTTTATPGALMATAEGSSETTKKGYALLCKTMPAGLASDASAPFTQEQWKKIISSLTGSGSIAAPSLAALAILTFGIMILCFVPSSGNYHLHRVLSDRCCRCETWHTHQPTSLFAFCPNNHFASSFQLTRTISSQLCVMQAVYSCSLTWDSEGQMFQVPALLNEKLCLPL